LKSSRKGSTSVCVVASPDPFSPGPSAFLVDNEETQEKTERDPDAPSCAVDGDIQLEYSSD
jgi:hypothetical protein